MKVPEVPISDCTLSIARLVVEVTGVNALFKVVARVVAAWYFAAPIGSKMGLALGTVTSTCRLFIAVCKLSNKEDRFWVSMGPRPSSRGTTIRVPSAETKAFEVTGTPLIF